MQWFTLPHYTCFYSRCNVYMRMQHQPRAFLRSLCSSRRVDGPVGLLGGSHLRRSARRGPVRVCLPHTRQQGVGLPLVLHILCALVATPCMRLLYIAQRLWPMASQRSEHAGNKTCVLLLQTVGDLEDGKVVAVLPVFSGAEGLQEANDDNSATVNTSHVAQKGVDPDDHRV